MVFRGKNVVTNHFLIFQTFAQFHGKILNVVKMEKQISFFILRRNFSNAVALRTKYGITAGNYLGGTFHTEFGGEQIPFEIKFLEINQSDVRGACLLREPVKYLRIQTKDEVVTSFSVNHLMKDLNKIDGNSLEYFAIEAKRFVFNLPNDCENGGFLIKLDVIFDENKKKSRPITTLDQIRLKMFDPPSNEPDFNIICKDDRKKSLKFHKNYLCQFSGYFQRMLENPTLRESQKNEMEIPNCSIKTLTTFRKILYEKSCEFDVKELSPELMIFADKYDVQFLYNFIRIENLKVNLNEENAIEMYKIAESKNDQEMLKMVFEFFKSKVGKMKKNEEWNEFAKNNPDFLAHFFEFTAFMDD